MSGSGRDTLPDVPEGWEALPDVRQLSCVPPGCAGGPPGCPGVVRWPSRMSRSVQKALSDVRSGREAHSDVWEWSAGPPGCPGVVGRPSWMSGSFREALPDDWELSGVPLGRLGGQPGGLRIVGTPSRISLRGARPFRMSGSCRVSLSDVRECSEGPLGCPGVVGMSSRLSGSCRLALKEVLKWLEDPPGYSAMVGRPSRMCGRPSRLSGSGRGAQSDVRV